MNLYSTRAATVVALIQLTLYMNGQLLNHEVWKRVRDCMLCYSTKTVPLFVIRTKMLQHYDWDIQETFGKFHKRSRQLLHRSLLCWYWWFLSVKLTMWTYFVKLSFMPLEKSQLITAEQSVSCMRTSLSTNTTIICRQKAVWKRLNS